MGGYKEIELWDKEAAEQRAIQEERWREAAAAASVLGDEAVQALACARKKIERFASAWAECFDSGALGTGCPVDRTWRRVDALMGVMLEELGELIDVPPLDDGVI